MEKDEKLKRVKSSAKGQYLGYSLQVVRFVHYLLGAPDEVLIGFEDLDDVVILNADGSVVLEQDKSSLTGNPAADSAVDLWKAFANWAQLIQDGHIDFKSTEFRYYAVGPTVNAGSLFKKVHAACDADGAARVLQDIQDYFGSKSTDTERYKHFSVFDGLSEDAKLSLIMGFHGETDNGDPLDVVRKVIGATVKDTQVDDVLHAAFGQATQLIFDAIRKENEARFAPGEFKPQFRAFVRKHNVAGYLNPTTAEPSIEAVSHVISNSPVFVRQLELIAAKDATKTRAVSDYLRTEADKVNWADKGEVFEGSFSDFDQSLIRVHEATLDELEETLSGPTPESQGRILYSRCMTATVNLEGREVPPHFVPGSFNHLADDRTVGWHQDYLSLLSKGEAS